MNNVTLDLIFHLAIGFMAPKYLIVAKEIGTSNIFGRETLKPGMHLRS